MRARHALTLRERAALAGPAPKIYPLDLLFLQALKDHGPTRCYTLACVVTRGHDRAQEIVNDVRRGLGRLERAGLVEYVSDGSKLRLWKVVEDER